jgi:hypothetical protein
MYLRHTTIGKDGKLHRYWRLVRSVRVARHGQAQRIRPQPHHPKQQHPITVRQAKPGWCAPQGDAELAAKKKIFGQKPSARLEQSTMNIQSACKVALIDSFAAAKRRGIAFGGDRGARLTTNIRLAQQARLTARARAAGRAVLQERARSRAADLAPTIKELQAAAASCAPLQRDWTTEEFLLPAAGDYIQHLRPAVPRDFRRATPQAPCVA